MIVIRNRKPITGMTQRAIQRIVYVFTETNIEVAYINTKESPFLYLSLLRECGVKAMARPVIENRKFKGLRFKKVA